MDYDGSSRVSIQGYFFFKIKYIRIYDFTFLFFSGNISHTHVCLGVIYTLTYSEHFFCKNLFIKYFLIFLINNKFSLLMKNEREKESLNNT